MSVRIVIFHDTLRLALAQPAAPSDEGPSVHVSALPRTLRLRRQLPSSMSERAWLLELEVEVPAIDPEQLLVECEDFLVDGRDGRQIGVVERVERSGSTGAASALFVSAPAGWFRRRRLRIDAQAIHALVPGERRMIVDETRLSAVGNDGQAS